MSFRPRLFHPNRLFIYFHPKREREREISGSQRRCCDGDREHLLYAHNTDPETREGEMRENGGELMRMSKA